jgi:hypothetical protein
VSDAHRLEDLGKNFVEIELKDLLDRAKRRDGWEEIR